MPFQLDIHSSGMLRNIYLVFGYRRFETTCRSHLHWSSTPRRMLGPFRFALI